MSTLLDRMSADLVLPPKDLIYLIRSAPYRYKVYDIPKKTPGKKRTIAQPAKELKPLQYWLMQHVLSRFPIHPAATAYRRGRSILDNAEPHVSHRYLCKLDFKNFFPSIKARDFAKFMAAHALESEWTKEEIDYMVRVLFWRRKREKTLRLSIGAPSSPQLSNILLYEFDSKVSAVCAANGVTYTRYADDLSFSTEAPNMLHKIEQSIAEICAKIKSPKLELNSDKTVHASKKGARRVTGLVLANDGFVSIGRDKKRQIRAAMHRYLRGAMDDGKVLELAGMLSYIRSVEPPFLQTLARRYGTDVLNHLLSTHRPLDRSEGQERGSS